jgi:hypothetical protein
MQHVLLVMTSSNVLLSTTASKPVLAFHKAEGMLHSAGPVIVACLALNNAQGGRTWNQAFQSNDSVMQTKFRFR